MSTNTSTLKNNNNHFNIPLKNKTKNAPPLRFPEFYKPWADIKLNKLLTESKSKNYDLNFGKESVLSVSGEFGIVNQIEHMGRSYAGVSVANYSIVNYNDIVYTKSPLKSNPYGIIKVNKGKTGIVSTLYAVYNPKPITDSLFIHYYFSLDDNVNKYLRPLVRKGAKNDMKINNSYVLTGIVYTPEIKEQQKISTFLSSIDIKIQQLTKKKKLLQQYKKGCMQQIFSASRGDAKGSGGLRFKDHKDNDFPIWDKKRLGEVAKIYDGTHMTPSYVESGVPFYSVEHVTSNDFTKTKYISQEVFEKENKRVKLKKGDILMTRIGDIGTSKYIDWDVEASFYVTLALLKTFKNVYPVFLNQYISSNKFQSELHKRTLHVAFPKKINLGEISQCIVQIPCYEEQQKIADFLTAIDKKIELVDTQLTKTQQFKKGLLQQMFV